MSLKRAGEDDDTHSHKRLKECRPPVISINPLQRLDLFKKRRSWRHSHLYAARSKQVTQARVTNYKDVSVQTDNVPTLTSHAVVLDKFMAVKDAERKLAGVYSGQLTYEPEEIHEHKVRFIENKKSDPLLRSEKVVQRDKIASGPSAGFNFLDKVEKRIGAIEESAPAPVESVIEPAKPLFGFDMKKAEDKPVMSFGSKQESKDKPKPSFDFGSKPEEKEQPAKKTVPFSFGPASSTDKKDTPSFNLASKPEEKEFTSSLFGEKKNQAPAFTLGSTSEEKNTDKPAQKPAAFNFSAPPKTDDKPSLLFGSGQPATDKADKPTLFNFGAKITEKKDDKPSMLFGTTTAASTSLFEGLKDVEKKESVPSHASLDGPPIKKAAPSFNFGASPTEEKKETTSSFNFSSQPEEKKKPAAFTFGSAPAESKETTPFSFGSQPPESKEPTPFTFSGASTTTEKKEPAPFTFGSNTDTKESTPVTGFTFGSKPVETAPTTSNLFGATSKEPTPASTAQFNFGSKPTEKKVQPLFGSAPASKEPTPFSFGNKPEEKKEGAPFSFGSPAPSTFGAKPTETSKPSVFGNAATDFSFSGSSAQSSTPLFSKPTQPATIAGFGATAPTTNTASGGFSFGSSKPAAPASTAFSFGGASRPQNPSSVFGAPSAPSGGFGQPANGGASSAFAFGSQQTQASTSAFGGGSATPAFGGTPQPQAPQFNTQGNVNFNFAGAGGSADPSSIFGAINGSNGFATSTPGMPQAQTPTPRVATRKIAQPRRRRG